MPYKKPEIKSYSAGDLLEAMGPCQNQYTTTTFNTTTGNSSVNVDGNILFPAGVNPIVHNAGLAPGDLEEDHPDWETQDQGLRSFVGFNISELQGKTIVSATLRLFQLGPELVGKDPYGNLGSGLNVDHVNFGTSLDSGDFSGNSIPPSSIGIISTNINREWKTIDVTTQVQADVNAGRTSSQYRLYFNTNINNNGLTEMAVFQPADNLGADESGNKPQLVVTYR